MLVCDRAGFVFIHNPKSAGTALRSFLRSFASDSNQKRFWHQAWDKEEGRVVDLAHLTPGQLDRCLSQEERSLIRVGFVREPMNRFASGLREVFRRHSEIASLSNTELFLLMTPANLRYDWRLVHLCPQVHFFYSGNKLRADYVGRFESLDSSWSGICAMLGLQEKLPNVAHERAAVNCERTNSFLEFMHGDRDLYWKVVSLYLEDFLSFNYPLPAGYTMPDSSYSRRIEISHRPASRSLRLLGTTLGGWSPGEQAAYSGPRRVI